MNILCRLRLSNYPQIRSIFHQRYLSIRRSKRLIKSIEQSKTSDSIEGHWKRLIVHPTLFTIGLTGTSFICCSIWNYESHRRKINSINNRFWSNQSTVQLKNIWKDLKDSQRLIIQIIGLNSIVFLAWKIQYLQKFIMKYFTSTPFKSNLLSMVLSTFSHQNSFHLFCNMYVLWSFSDPIIQTYGKHEFLAIYLSSGVISTWTSYLFKLISRSTAVSLGASGSIMALIGIMCTKYPDSQLCIIFLPFLSFSAKSGLIGIISFDILGLVRQWKVLDHAAHLGGVFFGIFYASYGHQIFVNYSKSIIDCWRRIKKKFE